MRFPPTSFCLVPLLVAAGSLASAQQPAPAEPAPTIEIVSLPPFAAAGSLVGQVTAPQPALYEVATYIFVSGLGWYVKPTAANPTVPVQSNGSFAVYIGANGLDPYATHYVVALVRAGVTPPIALGTPTLPRSKLFLARDREERYGRTLDFGGHSWGVKEAPLPVDPGQNRFSSDLNDVFVDPQGQLHLKVRFHAGQWWCSEVVLLESLGRGTYWFVTDYQVDTLDPNLTFGAFTYDDDGWGSPHTDNVVREIDFEDSRWGVPSSTTNSQFVVQPWWRPWNLTAYTIPDLGPDPKLTRFLVWDTTELEFVTARGWHLPDAVPDGDVVLRRTYVHDPPSDHYVPSPGNTRWRFNLWINTGGQPSNGAEAEVVVSDFRFFPH